MSMNATHVSSRCTKLAAERPAAISQKMQKLAFNVFRSYRSSVERREIVRRAAPAFLIFEPAAKHPFVAEARQIERRLLAGIMLDSHDTGSDGLLPLLFWTLPRFKIMPKAGIRRMIQHEFTDTRHR